MYFLYYVQKHSVQWENEKGTWQLHKNTNEKVKEYFPAHMRMGLFTNYIDKIFAFFDHLPPCVDIFYGMNVDKK